MKLKAFELSLHSEPFFFFFVSKPPAKRRPTPRYGAAPLVSPVPGKILDLAIAA